MGIGDLMKQAQEMQSKMQEMQARMEDVEMTGQAGAGLVSVTLNGKGEMRGLKMDPSLKDGDVEVMEDLILAAHADARRKAEVRQQEVLKEAAGGLDLPPGMNLPF